MSAKLRTLRLTGPFTDGEIQEFIGLLRRVDDANPTAIYSVVVVDANASMEDAERILRDALPPLPGRATNFARAAYVDNSYPERPCDHCGKSYRGPAVYCTIDCALADAG